MKRDFSTTVKSLDGKPVVEEGVAVTAGAICVNALLTQTQDDKSTGDEKVRKYKLATLIHGGGLQDVTSEDLSLLKKLIGSVYPPLVVGQLYEFLDSDPVCDINCKGDC